MSLWKKCTIMVQQIWLCLMSSKKRIIIGNGQVSNTNMKKIFWKKSVFFDLFHKVVVNNPGNSCYPIIHTNQPRELYLKYEKFKGKYCPGKCVFKCIGVILKGQISGQGLRFRP